MYDLRHSYHFITLTTIRNMVASGSYRLTAMSGLKI